MEDNLHEYFSSIHSSDFNQIWELTGIHKPGKSEKTVISVDYTTVETGQYDDNAGLLNKVDKYKKSTKKVTS